MALGVESASGICSARECTNAAIYRIDWRNPAIHRGRTKTWLACEEHLSYLEGYFTYRSFPYEVSPFVAPPPLAARNQAPRPISPTDRGDGRSRSGRAGP